VPTPTTARHRPDILLVQNNKNVQFAEKAALLPLSNSPARKEPVIVARQQIARSVSPPPAASKQRSVIEYTFGEEVANSVTHGIGALLAVVGLVLLVVTAHGSGGGVKLAAAAVYGATLVLEYLNSTLYHAFPWPGVKRVFKILDHSSIYLLIAGTYTPFTLVTLAPAGGVWLAVVIWALALVGVATEAFWLFRPRWLAAAIYLCMGWIVVFRFGTLMELMPGGGVALLLAGGICYSLGIIFYVMKKVRYMHSVWHLWTLAGSTLHFLAVLFYVL